MFRFLLRTTFDDCCLHDCMLYEEKLTQRDGYFMTKQLSEIWCQHLSVPRKLILPITIQTLTANIQHIHTQTCTEAHTRFVFCTLRGDRVLKECHHHSLQEAIMDRKLIHSTDIPAPRVAYSSWVMGKIG